MSELRKYIYSESDNVSRLYRANNRRIEPTAREKFDSYGDQWEKTYFDEKSGGFVVTEKGRIEDGNKSGRNKDVFDREEEVCRFFAEKGFQVEHIAEPEKIKAPDARIVRGKHSLIRINGELAEIKDTRSVTNVVGYGTDAVSKKKAKVVIFRFTERNPELVNKVYELARKNIHGFYYFLGDNQYKEF